MSIFSICMRNPITQRIKTPGFALLATVILLLVAVKTPAATLSLDMPETGAAGKTFTAGLGFMDVDNILSFELVVHFQSGSILTSGVDKFSANQTFFVETQIAGEHTNFLINPILGKIYVVGLTPNSASGAIKIGDLVFTISANASVNDSQMITLEGQIYTNTGEVQSLIPVSKTINVEAFVDTDGDQMDDQWELDHFGSLSRDGSGDFDMDGLSDLQEFQMGLDPKEFNPGYLTPGDIDNSKVVDLNDVILGLQVATGMPGSKPVYKGTDVNGDGKIGVAEFIYILQKIANLK